MRYKRLIARAALVVGLGAVALVTDKPVAAATPMKCSTATYCDWSCTNPCSGGGVCIKSCRPEACWFEGTQYSIRIYCDGVS